MASRVSHPLARRSAYASVNVQANQNPFVPAVIPYRGAYASKYFLPDPRFLEALGPNMMPFAFTLFDSAQQPSGTLGSQQTARGNTAQQPESWILSIVGSTFLAGGAAGNYAAMFYDSQREAIWMDMPIFFGNVNGSARHQWFLKKPYLLPANGQIQSIVTNLSTANNDVQIVAWGVRADGS